MKFILIDQFRNRSLLLLLTLLVFFTGCIKENTEDCEIKVYMQFAYTYNPEDTDQIRENIQTIDLFIYDQNGRFVQRKTIQESMLDDANGIELLMRQGSYQAIAWGNYDTKHYNLTEGDGIQDMVLQLKHSDNEVTGLLTHLYHGITNFEVKLRSDNKGLISFVRDTNDIHVTVTEKSSIVGTEADFTATITGGNGKYYFDNTRAGREQVTYNPLYSKPGKVSTKADFSVLRMFVQDDLVIKIANVRRPEVMFEYSLTDLIMKAPHINGNDDFDRFSDYELTFFIERDAQGNQSVGSITVDDWEVVSSSGGGV